MLKTAKRALAALCVGLGLVAVTAGPRAFADSTIEVNCSAETEAFHRCEIKGKVDDAVTEFDWELSEGVQVPLVEVPMASGNGTIQLTKDKVIVKFNEDYARDRENLTFSGFTDVIIDSWNFPSPYVMIVEGDKIDFHNDDYCEVCRKEPTNGVFKSMWDNDLKGTVDGQLVLGRDEIQPFVGQEITFTELGGTGLQNCRINEVSYQDATDGRIWHPINSATGIGTTEAKVKVDQPQAHRAVFSCDPVPGVVNVTNKGKINGQDVENDWRRKNAGADGQGDLKDTPPPSQSPSPSPSVTASPSPSPSATTKKPSESPSPKPTATSSSSDKGTKPPKGKDKGRPGLPKTGD